MELGTWLEQRFAAYRFAINREPVADEVWVEAQAHADGDFPWSVDVHLPSAPIAEELDHVSAFAKHMGCNALASDESINPFTFVLLPPAGGMLWVEVDAAALDEHGAFVVTGPASRETGRLSSATRLEPVLLTQMLSQLLGAPPAQVRTREDIGPPALPTSLYEHWHPIVDGVHYRFIYAVSVTQELRRWRSLEEDAAHWERIVSELSLQYQQPFCAHSEHLEQISNIPGGSDSECRCIWVDGVSRREVVTKRRRTSW